MAHERVLYQFPISHYCEKTRWNLDVKGLTYEIRDLVPGLHLAKMWRLTGATTVPVLVDRGTAIGDSAKIAQHLDRAYPERPMLPAGEADRARALELELYFGKAAGRAVRQWIYGALLEARPGAAIRLMFERYGRGARLGARLAAPLLERALSAKYRLHPEGVASARRTLDEVVDRLDREIGGDPARYLAGGALSIADITAASLLAPLVIPPGSPWDTAGAKELTNDRLLELRATFEGRPAWAWVRARYAQDRRAA